MCPVAGLTELKDFKQVFKANSQKRLLDGHLWFSVATKHPRSPFLRIERLTCVLTILFTAMLVNILLFTYQNTSNVNDEQPLIKIGPIHVTGFAITMGILAALITLPVNMFIVLCFSGRRQLPPRKEPQLDQTTDRYRIKKEELSLASANNTLENLEGNDEEENDDAQEKSWRHVLREHYSLNNVKITILIITCLLFLECIILLLHNTFFNKANDAQIINLLHSTELFLHISKKIKYVLCNSGKLYAIGKAALWLKRRVLPFPWWFVLIGYATALATVCVCIYVIVVFGALLGEMLATQWLISMVVGTLESVVIEQPLKVNLNSLFE